MIRFFAGHPTAANLLMIGLLAIGLFSAPTLQRETFPRIEPRRVQVSVAYPGARPEDVEEAICRRIEDAVDGIDNVYEVQCEARESMAIGVLEMEEGADLDRFFSDVETEVRAIDDFPDAVEDPVIRQLGRTDFVTSLAVVGPDTRPDLKAYAEDIKERMLAWGGVPKVEVTGFSDHQIRIAVPDMMLRQFGLSLADIAGAISRQSVDLPAGNIETRGGDVLVRFADERKTVPAFEDLIVVSGRTGGQVRLGEIATITDTFELAEQKVVFNGRPAAILDITKTENDDTLAVIDAVNAFLETERAVAPPGVSLVVINDISSIVRDRITMLLENLWQGLLLVFIAMWLFFGLRYSFWITMGLPVSFMGAFAVMVVLGYSVNMLSMVALLIVVGLLMDDAIVIAENIAAHRQRGKKAFEAAVAGTREVMPGVLASFTTTVCIFGSLAFLRGDIGQLLRVIPIVMIAVLVVSLIEAFLILPHHLLHSLEQDQTRRGIQGRVDRGIDWARQTWIGPATEATVRWRYLTLGCATGALCLALAAMAGGLVKFTAFPELDGDTVEARVLLPQGTPLARTEEIVDRITEAMQRIDAELTPEQPGERPLVRHIAAKFSENVDANETGPHVATVTVDLLENEFRTTTNDALMARWREETGAVADVISLKFAEFQGGPGGKAIDIRLLGGDLGALKRASLDLQDWLAGYQGTHSILDDLRRGKPEITVRMTESGTALGLRAQEVADQLRKAFFGTTVSEVQAGRESLEIEARLASVDRDSLADLDYFTIATPTGNLVPLTAVARLERERGYARINRVDRQRAVTIQGEVDTRIANANEIINDTRARFFPELRERYPGIEISVQGQDREAAKTQQSMITGFGLGLIGVFLLLSFQFRSYSEPVVVMFVIPFAFIGTVAGHILMGLDFTMPSMLGFIALAGVVVNDSILLVNFIKREHEPGLTVAEVAPTAARARFRAILLTSVTTVLGLLPLLAETSLQAQVLIPLVTSLAFGLVAATMLVLFVVPAFYAILDDFGLTTLSTERAALARGAQGGAVDTGGGS